MIRRVLIDQVALALVRQMLLLAGQIKGKDYSADPGFDYEGELSRDDYWQLMAEAAVGAMEGEIGGAGEQCAPLTIKRTLSVLGTRVCNECHAVFDERVWQENFPCPACRQIAETRAMIAEKAGESVGVELVSCSRCHSVYRLDRVQRTSFHCPACKQPDGLLRKVEPS